MNTGIVLEVYGRDIFRTTYEGPLSIRGLQNVLEEEVPLAEFVLAELDDQTQLVAFQIEDNNDPSHGYLFAGKPADDNTRPVPTPLLITARENGELRALRETEAKRIRIERQRTLPYSTLLVD